MPPTSGQRGRFGDASSFTPAPTIVTDGWDSTDSFPTPAGSLAGLYGGSPRTTSPLALVRATRGDGPPPPAPVEPTAAPSDMALPLVAPEAQWARAARSPAARRGALIALGAAALGVLGLSAARTIASGDTASGPATSAQSDATAAPSPAGSPAAGASSTARAAGSATSSAEPAVAMSQADDKLELCSCERSDSPLWSSPPPLLSIIPIPTRKGDGPLPDDISPRVDGRGRGRYEFDIAIVNNGKDDLNDVKLVLTFARRDARGERAGVTDRGLFWEGALGPGRSVKWSVKAPGTELRIDVGERRTLADVAAAPGDAYFSLLRARQAAVRLHAATMLAYVGDRRAETAARQLEGLSKTQEATREMVVRAASPHRVCRAKVQGETLSVCIDNTGDDALVSPELVEPTQGGRRAKLLATIAPHSGALATFERFGTVAEELIVQK